ncbi:Wzz/FepE/Etk N-terminal domain-containing protein [Legionella feeleii]|uniref:Chain length determinant protein WzzB n=1 Tax=Legionella feeleii TaxID=453 RepID=A0A378IUR2_9GAMM|nr:Wzz/FepE/Etk N-terminal domain-containing protein [Legionella feeleii]STX38957.1 chain length determinant protein WzzB [Legionella feeleii]
MRGQQTAAVYSNDEINVVALLRLLWQKKWIIFFVVLLTTAIGCLKIWNTQPVFEAKAYIVPPTAGDIAPFNYGRSYDKNSLLKPFQVKDVYQVFASSLLSQASMWTLFNKAYLPTLPVKPRDKASLNTLYKGFSSILTVKEGIKSPVNYTVVARSTSSAEAAKWVKRYIDVVKQDAISNMLNIAMSENQSLAHDFEQRINIVREIAKEQRYDRIKQLQEALNVAQVMESDAKLPPKKASLNKSGLYGRSSKVLKAEIATLNARQSDDAFAPELRKLEGEYNFLRKITINPADVAVFRLDGNIDISDTPIAPRKRLILAFSLTLGLVLGVVLVLMQAVFATNRANELAEK